MAPAGLARFHPFGIPQLIGAVRVSIAAAGSHSTVAIVRSYSVTFRTRACLFLMITALLLVTGALFALAGAWPVLLFCGLQTSLLACVWAELELHADDHELVSIDDDSIRFDAVHRRQLEHCRWQRHWARATWSEERERLCVRSHGREIEIAAGASRQDKLALYRHLGGLIGTARAVA